MHYTNWLSSPKHTSARTKQTPGCRPVAMAIVSAGRKQVPHVMIFRLLLVHPTCTRVRLLVLLLAAAAATPASPLLSHPLNRHSCAAMHRLRCRLRLTAWPTGLVRRPQDQTPPEVHVLSCRIWHPLPLRRARHDTLDIHLPLCYEKASHPGYPKSQRLAPSHAIGARPPSAHCSRHIPPLTRPNMAGIHCANERLHSTEHSRDPDHMPFVHVTIREYRRFMHYPKRSNRLSTIH